MDGRISATGALHAALVYWSQFFSQCVCSRLETSRFENYVKLVYPQYPLPPNLVADLFLRPQSSNHYNLDPRIPPYLQVLFRLGFIDTPSILKSLYKYSSSHTQSQPQPQPAGADGPNEKEPTKKPLRWGNSYWSEEVIFYSLTKSVVEGKAIHDSKTALEVAKIISKWMTLFTAASTAFAADMLGQLQTSQAEIRDEMESSRAAFVALLLRLCENDLLVKAVSKPFAKGTLPPTYKSTQLLTSICLTDVRKDLSASLANFVPTLQLVPQITEKLEQFRTQTLADLEPMDKKKQDANAAMDDLLDSTVGLENFVVADIPISNTRAGLYVYLNAAVSIYSSFCYYTKRLTSLSW